MRRCLGKRTVRYRAKECSSEISLLPKVHLKWDLRSVRTIGPGRYRSVGHGLDVCDSRDSGEGRVGVKRGSGTAIRASRSDRRNWGGQRVINVQGSN